ncbi:MAG: hypothetical protein COB15_06780, partial [Flavobacteriales bacterium]
ICYGASVSLLGNPSGAVSSTDWSPTGAFANPNATNPTVTPTGPTTYYINTSNGFCNKLDSITINVAGSPTGAIASEDTVCQGTLVDLNTLSASATCGINYSNCTGANVSAIQGTNTTASTVYDPFYGSTSSTLVYTAKRQYIFTSAELTAMGFTAGMITKLELDVSISTGKTYDNMEIWMGCTVQEDFPTTTFIPTASLTQVYSRARYTTALGWNAFDITGYNWDGTSSIVVQICSSNPDQTGSESARYTSTTPFYRTLYYSSGSVPACTNVTGSRVYNRPNMRFTFCSSSFGAGTTYSWSPTTVSNSSIQNPTTIVGGNATYTVTVTDPANPACATTGTVNVYIDPRNSVLASNDTTVCIGELASLNSIFSGPVPTTIPCGMSTVACAGANTTAVVGTATTSSSTYGPFYGTYSDVKYQFLYTAAELTAMGLTSGTITSIAFNISTKSSTGPFNGFTIKMGCTSATSLLAANGWEATAGVVYGPTNYTTTAGWNTFNLTNDIDWDGTSNIVIETCYNNSASVGIDSYFYTATTGRNTTMRAYNNVGPGCANTPSYQYAYHPNLRFSICAPPAAGLTYNWTPTATLNNSVIANPTATPIAPTTYVVTVTGGICDVYDTVNVIICTVLPTEILSFHAVCKEDRVILNWITSSEINNSHFSIEKSTDALNFTTIGTVNGNGNSSTIINYSWIDDNPFNGTAYYRLKQTDFNGAYEYHEVIAVKCNQDDNISIYPNPFENSFTVELSKNTTYPITVEVLDYLGRKVHFQTLETNVTEIVLDELPQGTYFVKVVAETSQIVERIVKLN